MGSLMRTVSIVFFLLIGLQVALAEVKGNSSGKEIVVFVQDTERTLKNIDRMIAELDVQPKRDIPDALNRAEARKAEEKSLPVRVYRLNYIKANDVLSLIKPLISSKGKITISGTDRNFLDKVPTIFVQDHETILKNLDRIIAEIDVQPKQVLIEAAVIEVTMNKDENWGQLLAKLVKRKKTPVDSGKEASPSSASDVVSATFVSSLGIDAGANNLNFAANKNGAHDDNRLKFAWCDRIPTQELSAREGVKILCCPRMLVLNKQRAEIHLEKELDNQAQTSPQTGTSSTKNFIKVGTQLRLRPFVTTDGMIRMEVHLEQSDGDFDDKGIPQTTVRQITANVMIPDGRTVAIGDLLSSEDPQSGERLPMMDQMNQLSWAKRLFPGFVDPSPKKALVFFLTPRILPNQ